ncbi:hypothetical protein N5F23_06995 [Pseudomonas sichuanensis]|uniref:hypothetical protein n=1 Tax=Pseudomonas sichuanensis TaxID=2213015 RepID=UPI00244A1810|nr:hypothetical protein [Pseudomonas sichuanensis]MDH0730277.1 hypothetical protein [Pseudomonas sichuanensis]MDH1582337.1 hypothetical protein [Pseudomonas sichuanensis]MDH1591734.1 hypothetical protein [Pseudomonas sichuanensis]MDH1599531.1 hypothetical protein [Pseudomonas sichuanensis]
MREANCSTISESCYDAAADMMGLYSCFFPIVQYLNSSDDRVRTAREQFFKGAVLQNFSELEDEYQNSLLICFGEHANVRAMRPLARPKLKHQITLLNAWNHMFEAFGTVDIFLAGLGIRTVTGQAVNRNDFRHARNRILCALRVLHQDCLSLIEASHIAEGKLLEHARAVVQRIDIDRVFD